MVVSKKIVNEVNVNLRDKHKHEELQFQLSYEQKKQIQDKIKKQFEYLHKVPAEEMRYEYLKAQARYICKLELTLRLGPFKGLYSKFLAMISDKASLEAYYIKFNEYGILEVDEARLNKLRVIKIDYDSLNK